MNKKINIQNETKLSSELDEMPDPMNTNQSVKISAIKVDDEITPIDENEEAETNLTTIIANDEIDTKLDLSMACKTQLVKRRDCLRLKQAINAKKYMQCSALDDCAVKHVIDTAIELALEFHLQKLKKKKWNINSTHYLLNDLINKNLLLDTSIESNSTGAPGFAENKLYIFYYY
jgi:hypothetical protein